MSTSQHEAVRFEITVEAPIERAFRVFTEQFDQIKPREHNIMAPEAIVETVFDAPALADAPAPGLVFERRWLSAPFVRDAADLERFIADAPAGVLTRPGRPTRSVADRVRVLVERGLGEEQPSAEELAAGLMVSAPTLRRQLAAEGTSVRAIREAVLRDAAVSAA